MLEKAELYQKACKSRDKTLSFFFLPTDLQKKLNPTQRHSSIQLGDLTLDMRSTVLFLLAALMLTSGGGGVSGNQCKAAFQDCLFRHVNQVLCCT